MTQNAPSVIAIDGPAASGKTTIGQQLAEKLDYLMLDTGSMYRAVTWAALQKGISCGDEAAIVDLAHTIQINILPAAGEPDQRLCTVLVDGADITWELRTAEVDANVSQVSSYHGVRVAMVAAQRKIGEAGNVVMIGRDIGTVVLPDAPLKLYIVASAEERARRRYSERIARSIEETFEDILNSIIRRDNIDSTREHSPLQAAEDAITIDTTSKTPEELLAEILALPAFQL